MRYILKALLLILCSYTANAGSEYLDKFNHYLMWKENLPTRIDSNFISFISQDSPLTQKLREKWLYQLAKNKDWSTFNQYYQDSKDIGLQCYHQLALYQQGAAQQTKSIALWLEGKAQPQACDELFNWMFAHHLINNQLITKRIALALDNQNIPLSHYLIKKYSPPRSNDIQLLNSIRQDPSRILTLNSGSLHSLFYLYGLQLMVTRNIEQAIKLFQNSKTCVVLTETQQQKFLAHLALYKAMKNQTDTSRWFSKVKPAFYNDVLLEWQIRFALKNNNWPEVLRIISFFADKDLPTWQYWKARALAQDGQTDSANQIYKQLAHQRNYYGFLASLQLNQSFHFKNEQPSRDLSLIEPYQTFLLKVKRLYQSKQELEASRLLNDFIIELPKDEKSALTYWLDNDLNWYGKSVYLSNSNDELSNQLSLRFPLAYSETIKRLAKQYQVSPAFVYAIIRQESGFRFDITSPAGASGLMQLMPRTASLVAKHARISYQNKQQLFISDKNINIGVAYLHQLSHQYKKHSLLMAAAYNAGPKQVSFWRKKSSSLPIDIWIETLPWRETRNYLKNIVSFYLVYQYRLNDKPNLNNFLHPIE